MTYICQFAFALTYLHELYELLSAILDADLLVISVMVLNWALARHHSQTPARRN